VEQIYRKNNDPSRMMRAQISYQNALSRYKSRHGIARISWATWAITLITVAVWCFTAYQAALAAGAHTVHDILINIWNNTENGDVLVLYGAKENSLIVQGQYWRFITPIFLHATILHVALNMLNLVILGVFVERLVGHLRFLLIYFVTGVVSIIASFALMPGEVSVGASGAIFGLVGAYSMFILLHRRALPRGGIPAILWLVVVIGANLSIGLFIPNIDNYAHLGGLLSGCLLGWWFTPHFTLSPEQAILDTHSLAYRWPLALLTLLGTFFLAIIALHFGG
jgi:membrane associated rhomboid family serine protease